MRMPPSPWIGSTRIAARFVVDQLRRPRPRSPYGAYTKAGQQRADAFVIFGLGRGAGGAVGAAVKAALKRDDLVALLGRVQPGQLDRRFVRFRARVAEERLAAEAPLGEHLGPAALRFGVPGVGHVDQLGHLLLHRLDDPRRTVAQQVAAPAGKEVEIPPALVVPHVRPLAAHERHREPRVVRHDVLVEQLGRLRRHADGGGHVDSLCVAIDAID